MADVPDDVLGVMSRDERHRAEEKLKKDNEDGKAMFMVCKCQREEPHPAGFVPVVVRENGQIYLASIMCVECGTPGYFREGRLILSQDDIEDED